MSYLAVKAFFVAFIMSVPLSLFAQKPVPVKPRVIISTDIGGTDPDDNQSMTHLLMYTDKIDLEGLISSPSFGDGSADEIRRMISIYEKDFKKLRKHCPGLMKPSTLRSITKQGHHGLFPFKGYDQPTEGSKLIVKQARKRNNRPLWVLVWGTLEDVAQALHDAPDIEKRIRVYFIGRANKKWGVCSYNYVVRNFPNLWMIENNGTYSAFPLDKKSNGRYAAGFYDYALRGAGHLGADFINYYNGIPKMGDTPSFLYMLDGDPENPMKESWGGSFVKVKQSARRVINRQLTERDTVPLFTVMEFRFKGPHIFAHEDSVVFTATIDKQQWPGYYVGDGNYVLLYSPKAPARLTYVLSSSIKDLDGLSGAFVVDGVWPGTDSADNYPLGDNWYSDRPEKEYSYGGWQGAATQKKWVPDIFEDWAQRLRWLKE